VRTIFLYSPVSRTGISSALSQIITSVDGGPGKKEWECRGRRRSASSSAESSIALRYWGSQGAGTADARASPCKGRMPHTQVA
jgi:hypothetical protein